MCHHESAVWVLPDVASSQPGSGQRLLWVDDSRPLLGLYKAIFESLGFEVQATCSPQEALEHLSSQATDVAILDYEMPDMNGSVLASLIKGRHPELPVILYSGSVCIPQDAHHWVDAICSKAAPREELLAMIEETLARRAGSERRASFHPARSSPSQFARQ
jgi:DNA-binding NtrC family response regulator